MWFPITHSKENCFRSANIFESLIHHPPGSDNPANLSTSKIFFSREGTRHAFSVE
jgi:hypothetical protein